MMRTKVSAGGQTVIPAELRRRYGINEETRLDWVDDNGLISVVPVPGKPIEALRGATAGQGMTAHLLRARREERRREERQERGQD
ncbi:MAG: AbrB/MazE/SpoVT family DNA-binding domain-containing protein [Armatimonadota bacterium]